ncbi:hypothetical protein [Streptomyces sp. NBC_01643]|uniref:hypothetical protein n=1 Tax=Streptomyces sp. NBC_01643 TaxID=2975906 RepID=UPI003865CA7C|nr:hypothetical protein OHB03_00100 [Streptomyces sp. NBC_01643]WTD38857.1 hypothetical protein OHB03_46175 [Streptomyces sp. NBC_01643]
MSGEGHEVLQDNTFVLRSQRGRGLGTLAKLSNLRLLGRHYPHAQPPKDQKCRSNKTGCTAP